MTTIRDVANKAEVSIATVSRVVNGNRPVHPDIRERNLLLLSDRNVSPYYSNVFRAREAPDPHHVAGRVD